MKKFSDFIKKSAEPQRKEPASNVIKGRFKIANQPQYPARLVKKRVRKEAIA